MQGFINGPFILGSVKERAEGNVWKGEASSEQRAVQVISSSYDTSDFFLNLANLLYETLYCCCGCCVCVFGVGGHGIFFCFLAS